MTRDNYAALQSKIEKEINRLQKQAQALQAKRRNPVIASIIQSMREYNITPAELAAALNKKSAANAQKNKNGGTAKTTRTVPPKYRNPESGETWTGRGKPPRWVSAAEAQGKSRDSFLIAE